MYNFIISTTPKYRRWISLPSPFFICIYDIYLYLYLLYVFLLLFRLQLSLKPAFVFKKYDKNVKKTFKY